MAAPILESEISSKPSGWRRHIYGPIDRKFLFISAIFFGNFFIAKLCIYFAPLLIAAIAPGPIYGAIELAQSFGLLLSSFIIGAPLAGLTQNYLVRGDRHIIDQLAAIAALFCGLSLVLSIGIWSAGFAAQTQLIIAAFASIVIHNVAGTWFRNRAARNLTAWVDGTAGLLAVAAVLVSIILFGVVNFRIVTHVYIAIAAFATIAATLLLIKTATQGLWARLLESTRIGIPMIVVGTMATWLGVGGRLTVGALANENIAAYGVAFRVAGLALGVHQLAVTGLFAMLYRARTKEADSIMAMFFTAVAILLIFISFSGSLVVYYFDLAALDANGRNVFVRILPITCLQTFFWIGYALLQMRVNRTGLAAKSIIPTAIIMFGGIGIIFGAGYFAHITIETLCWLIALHASAFFFLSVYMLSAKRRLPHVLMMRTGIIGGIALSVAAATGHYLL